MAVSGNITSTGRSFSSLAVGYIEVPAPTVGPFNVATSGLLVEPLVYENNLSAVIKGISSASIKGLLSVNINTRAISVSTSTKLSSSIKNNLEATLCL